MQPQVLKFLKWLTFFALLGLALPKYLWAQACCSGSSTLTPGRLAVHEDAAVGLMLRSTWINGSFDQQAHYASAKGNTREWDGEEDLLGTVRVLKHGQVTALVPVNESFRSVPTVSEAGGGIGDINLSGRYDFSPAGRSVWLPGIAALVGLTLPTGRAADQAHRALATDATGIGAFQVSLGLALEQTFGNLLLSLNGILTQRASRQVGGISSTLGLQFAGLLGAGYSFDNGAAVAASLAFTDEGNAQLNRQTYPLTGRRLTILGLSGSIPLGDTWRLQGGAFDDLPVTGLGRNQPAGLGFSFSVIRTWS